MLKPLFANQQLKNTKLRDCTYSCGGGMLGGYSSATIRRMEDGSVKYITKHAAAHYERIVTNTYEAKEEDLERIKNMSIDYKMLQASKKGEDYKSGDVVLSPGHHDPYYDEEEEEDEEEW